MQPTQHSSQIRNPPADQSWTISTLSRYRSTVMTMRHARFKKPLVADLGQRLMEGHFKWTVDWRIELFAERHSSASTRRRMEEGRTILWSCFSFIYFLSLSQTCTSLICMKKHVSDVTLIRCAGLLRASCDYWSGFVVPTNTDEWIETTKVINLCPTLLRIWEFQPVSP